MEPYSCRFPYFHSVYPQQHKRWRSEGRLLLFCGESAGFGAYLSGVVAAFVASVLSERALIIGCSQRHEAARITGVIGHYFNGEAFNWHPDDLDLSHLQKDAFTVSEPALRYLRSLGPMANLYNRSVVHGFYVYAATCPVGGESSIVAVGGGSIAVFGSLLLTPFCRGDRPIFFHASEHSGPERMLQRGTARDANVAAFGRTTGMGMIRPLPGEWAFALQVAPSMQAWMQ